MSKNRIVVGTRGSKLAIIQTEMVVARLKRATPGLEVSISRITTKGDRERHKPFDDMEGTGVFVKELEIALLDGDIDVAVHSLKDMTTEIPPRLCLAAVAEREDPRDVLISSGARKLAELPSGSVIGTGSPRRTVQLKTFRSDLMTCSIRGNVDSRLRRVDAGELDGVIVAAAGVIRLGLAKKISEYLPLEHFLPAVGQGALAIETRDGDKETNGLVSTINHLPTWQSVTAERAFLRTLGGGCEAPIAALGTVSDKTLKLQGMVSNPEGTRMLKAEKEGKATEAEAIGIRLAKKFLDTVAADFIAEAKKSARR